MDGEAVQRVASLLVRKRTSNQRHDEGITHTCTRAHVILTQDALRVLHNILMRYRVENYCHRRSILGGLGDCPGKCRYSNFLIRYSPIITKMVGIYAVIVHCCLLSYERSYRYQAINP